MSSGAALISIPQINESFLIKTVILLDWWLVKSQDGSKISISVSGISYSQKQLVRMFSSAPIAKRFDVFTLETCDGVTIILKGIINTQKSIDNGFQGKVVKKFCFGFPENWQQYALETELESLATDPLKTVNHSPVPNKKRTRADHLKTRVAQNKEKRQGGTKHKSPARKEPQIKSAGTLRQINIQKKINLQERATARSKQAEKYVLPPESLSVGRSRSGRILLPTLDFWRNQIPVYEMDRTVSGIWEERYVPVLERGSRTEPRKRLRRER